MYLFLSTFELDFKLVSNGYFWPDLRYLKTPKGQTCLPLFPEILKTGPAVIKKKNQLLTVLAKLAQNESVQKRIILPGWANLSFPKTKMTPTEL